MALAIGPCMFVAPLVPVLFLLAIPLWPVAIVAMTLFWLVTWPLEVACRVAGIRAFQGASKEAARWLRIVLRPWVLFAPPPKRPSEPPSGPSPEPPGTTPR
jgi:hypothetical protein